MARHVAERFRPESTSPHNYDRGVDATSGSTIADRHGIRERAVALTFDDGPSEWTEPILDLLREQGARATFFVLGNALPGREEIVRRILAEGSELGNHSYTHRRLTTLADAEIRFELEATQEAIRAIAPVHVRFWRPPHFGYDERVLGVACELGLRELVRCSIDPADYRSTADEIVARVLSKLEPGSIVDLHDGRPAGEPPEASAPTREATVDAVRVLLASLQKAGYSALTLSELLAAA